MDLKINPFANQMDSNFFFFKLRMTLSSLLGNSDYRIKLCLIIMILGSQLSEELQELSATSRIQLPPFPPSYLDEQGFLLYLSNAPPPKWNRMAVEKVLILAIKKNHRYMNDLEKINHLSH